MSTESGICPRLAPHLSPPPMVARHAESLRPFLPAQTLPCLPLPFPSPLPATPHPAAAEGNGQSASAAPVGAVVVYANELEYFGDQSTGNIRRWVGGWGVLGGWRPVHRQHQVLVWCGVAPGLAWGGVGAAALASELLWPRASVAGLVPAVDSPAQWPAAPLVSAGDCSAGWMAGVALLRKVRIPSHTRA